jgi:nucleoside-diphosphate-sugar epimerase
MKLLITGASGFLGQHVVAKALEQGYKVVALVRPKTNLEMLAWHNHPQVTIVRHDLRQSRGLAHYLDAIDGVIHLAATKAGDFYAQFAGTVLATENLLSAMSETGVDRLIAISTFSVYDYRRLRSWQVLDESAPIEANPQDRDEYTQTKLVQEQLYRTFGESGRVTILRPGMIYGRDTLWHARLGAEIGHNRWLKVGGHSILPMIYAENCAEAIVQAVEAAEAIGETINLVDDDLPTQQVYLDQILPYTPTPPQLIPVSWWTLRTVTNLAWWINQRFLQGQARLPGILVPAKVQGRFKPLRYSNTRAKQLLNWQPRYDLGTALARSVENSQQLELPTTEKEPALV